MIFINGFKLTYDDNNCTIPTILIHTYRVIGISTRRCQHKTKTHFHELQFFFFLLRLILLRKEVSQLKLVIASLCAALRCVANMDNCLMKFKFNILTVCFPFHKQFVRQKHICWSKKIILPSRQ